MDETIEDKANSLGFIKHSTRLCAADPYALPNRLINSDFKQVTVHTCPAEGEFRVPVVIFIPTASCYDRPALALVLDALNIVCVFFLIYLFCYLF